MNARARGQSIVELGLIAPMLILLAVSVWDGGSVLHEQVVLQQAARDGARAAGAAYAPSVLPPCTAPVVTTSGTVAQAVQGSAWDMPALQSSPGYLSICYPDAHSVQVNVQYSHALITPVLRLLWSAGTGAITLHASATFYTPPLTPVPSVVPPSTPTSTPVPPTSTRTPTPVPPTSTPTPTPVPPTPTPTPGVRYVISNMASHKPLADPDGSLQDGGRIIQWRATGGAEQQWAQDRGPNGRMRLINAASALFLADPGGSLTDGTGIVQAHEDGGTEQEWSLRDRPNGGKLIRNLASGKLLSAPVGALSDGAAMIQSTDDGGLEQEWLLAPCCDE